MTTPESTVAELSITTRCPDVAGFIARFHRFCDDNLVFVETPITRPVGTQCPVSILLADQTPVLVGRCVVIGAWTDAANPFKRPGMRLRLRRLTPDSLLVLERLQAAREAAGHYPYAAGVIPPPAPPTSFADGTGAMLPLAAPTEIAAEGSIGNRALVQHAAPDPSSASGVERPAEPQNARP